MKKLLFIVAVIAAVMTLAGCQVEDDNTTGVFVNGVYMEVQDDPEPGQLSPEQQAEAAELKEEGYSDTVIFRVVNMGMTLEEATAIDE